MKESSKHNPLDLPSIHLALRSLMMETGTFILQERKKFDQSSIEFKGGNDMVTHVDRGAEEKLVEGCMQILPGSGFLLEEGGVHDNNSPWRWVIDPIDGTTNFVHGMPFYAISVGLQVKESGAERDWTTVLGAVYCPPMQEYFHAIKGGGAFLNDLPIQVSGTAALKKGLIATGFPYDEEAREATLPILGRMLQNCQGIRRDGAAAMDLANVACGRLDGYFERTLQAWDVAAGILLVQEAGGKISDWKRGEDYFFGEPMLSSNGHVHEEMLALLD